MADWQDKIDLREEWNSFHTHKIDIKSLCAQTAAKISLCKSFQEDSDLRDIVDAFRDLSNEEDITVHEFDSILSDLYDWGDTEVGVSKSIFDAKKKCWIMTW